MIYNGIGMAIEKQLAPGSVRRPTIDTIESDAEMDALVKEVLDAGNVIAATERQEMIRKGILDVHGRLLKNELPEDMLKDKDRDFGG